MKYKRILIECSKNYAAKIFRNPFFGDSSLRWHKEYEIIYVAKGSVKLKKLKSTISIKSGEIYFLNSEEVHAYLAVSPDTEYIVINFRRNIVNQYIGTEEEIINFKLDNKTAYENILSSVKEINMMPKFDNCAEVIKIRSILLNILYYLVKYCVSYDTNYIMGSLSEDFDYAKVAIDYMIRNYRNNITLNEISEYVGLSPSHFSKYFKEKTDVTFSRYLRQIRLEKALLDMSNNGASVKEAAVNNGFPNVNSFIATCKEICNRTPLETVNFMMT